MEDDLDRIAAGALARRGMLEGFWGPFEAALGEAGGLTRKTVRAAIEDRLDEYLFGPDGAEPGRRRCPACGGDTTGTQAQPLRPLRRLRGLSRTAPTAGA